MRAVLDTNVLLSALRGGRTRAVLNELIAGRADCIVTGDQDLLALHPFRGIRILRPAAFLRLLSHR